jgi:hypothetical protein
MNLKLSGNRLTIVDVFVGYSCSLFRAHIEDNWSQLSWDGQDYARLTRQLVRGDGHTSKSLLPSFAPGLRDGESWPSVFRPPFFVFLTSLCFRVFGSSDTTAVLWSGLLYIGTVVLYFREL